MKKMNVLLLATVAAFAACNKESRDGQLTLAGSNPLRIADESGKTVEFVNGALKAAFEPGSKDKVTVSLEQAGQKAKFTAKIPDNRDWNFTLRGKDAGQNVDMASKRTITLTGEPKKRYGTGGFCGFDGRWQTEEIWRDGKEDWKVAFADSQTGYAVAAFESHKNDTYLVESKNIWCRENPRREPGGGRWDRLSSRIEKLKTDGVKFD
jgi:hypothetical protein